MYYCKEFDICAFVVVENNGKITHVLTTLDPLPEDAGKMVLTPLIQIVFQQLDEYFKGRRHAFSFPIQYEGRPFFTKTMNALKEVGFGEIVTYGQLAEQMGTPQSARAVGHALHCNPLLICLPCHRIVGANGKLTGYRGGLEMKSFLLQLEREKNPFLLIKFNSN